MKRILLYVIITGAIVSGIFLFSINKKSQMPKPVDTEIVDGEDETHFIRRKEWIDAMHSCAPEVHWQQIDNQSRYLRMKKIDNRDEYPGIWTEVGSNNQAGRTLLADYDSITGLLYVLSCGGNIWRGTPQGVDWESLNDHFQITGAHFFRRIPTADGERWFIATSKWNVPGFMFSDDQGQTWTYANGFENTIQWGTLRRAAMIMDNDIPVFYALTMEWDYTNWYKITCIYKSVDQGVSFQKIAEYPEPQYGTEQEFDLWADYYLQDNVYFVENENFGYINEYDEFVNIGTVPSTSGNTRLSGYKNGDTQKFYVSKTANGSTTFYGSDNAGIAWSQRGTVAEGPFSTNSFSASLTNPDALYFGGVNAYRSFNGGSSWQKVNEWYDYYNSPIDKLHADIPGMCPFLIDGVENLFINTDGGTYISTDNLLTVENISMENLRVSQYYSTLTLESDPSVIFAGAQDQGYQRSVVSPAGNQIYDFDQLISGDYGHLVSGDGGVSTWCVYPAFAMYYPDAANTNNKSTWDFVGTNFFWMPQLMADPENPQACYLAGGSTSSGSHIYHLSCNGYISYDEDDFDFSEGGDGKISAMAFSPINTDNRYVLTSTGDFFYSRTSGDSWEKSTGFTGPGTHYFYGASIVPSAKNPQLLFIGGSGYSASPIYRSDDNGETFTTFSVGFPNTLVFDMVLNDDETLLFAATEIGPYVCDLETEQWYDLTANGVPEQAYWSVEWVNNFARFASYGRGIWDFTPSPAPVPSFISTLSTGCEGVEVSFTDQSTQNPQSWLWEFEGGEPNESTEQNPQNILYATAGNYDVKLSVTNGAGTSTITLTDYITVLGAPISPEMPMGPDSVKFTNTETEVAIHQVDNASEYLWNLFPQEAGTLVSIDTTAIITWNADFLGEASVSVSAQGECGTSSSSPQKNILRYLNVGMENYSAEAALFPNPATHNITIQLPAGVNSAQIVSSNGKQHSQLTKQNTVLNISTWNPGVYFVIYVKNGKKISLTFSKI